MHNTLIIRHQNSEQNKHSFCVVRQSDAKTSTPVTLTAPDNVQVQGRPNSTLTQDLRWYLEDYLKLPTGAYPDLAERVLEALDDWGKDIFSALFSGRARDWYQDIRRNSASLSELTIKIASDDPRILAWPWEALCDPEGTTLAHTCRIERQLSELHDPLPLPEHLPNHCLNILLIIARPYGDEDIGYHAVSRPLIELSQQQDYPVNIQVLRPPTFEQLQSELAAKPGFYHIVHFDGHGGYGDVPPAASASSFKGAQGKLVFESETSDQQLVSALQLTQLISEYRIPIMVLNACQSARVDQSEDAFASVAGALLKAGIRSVVAMGYNLWVSGAQQFVPGFYQQLLAVGDVAEASRAGRKAMLSQPLRISLLGKTQLQDWLVPVLYQQDPLVLTFDQDASEQAADHQAEAQYQLPPEAQLTGDYGFIGRERAVHALERAMQRQPQAGILIHGMAGIGKTTLTQGFLRWLQQTNGLNGPVFWFSFETIHSFQYVINQLVEALLGQQVNALPDQDKQAALIAHLNKHPCIVVWDNFESASGIEGTEITALLPEADRQQLKDFLRQLRNGQSKVLLTSRSAEDWLGITRCYGLPTLSGLQGEECWEYCNAVVADLGLQIKRENAEYAALMDALNGHPLVMRTILLRLQHSDPATVLEQFNSCFANPTTQSAADDDSTQHMYAALTLLTDALPETMTPILQLIGLHQAYVDFNLLHNMLENAAIELEGASLQSCRNSLQTGGLIEALGQNQYRLHPALTGFLNHHYPADARVQQVFVDVFGTIADSLTAKELHEKRGFFQIHAGNCYQALSLAVTLTMDSDIAALTQSLAAYALNTLNFSEAQRLYQQLADHRQQTQDQQGVAGAYHQLGRIAELQRDFSSAERWYRKSLAIEEKIGNEHGTARVYHQLGMIAEEQRDFSSAERWYRKSLAIEEKQGNEHGAASTYHQLGIIAEHQRDFSSAERWYRKALAIKEKQGNEYGAATTYHQLGCIAQEQGDFSNAERWYMKSLAIFEKQGNELDAALIYYNLGRIAEEQVGFSSAERWYMKSLAIFEKFGNKHRTATIYHQLGIIAQQQRDFNSAKSWYGKSLAIFEKQGNEYDVGLVYHNLGLIDQEQGGFSSAERWYRKSLVIKEKQGNEYGAATTYHQLGSIAQEQGDFSSAERWYRKSLAIKEKQGNEHGAASTYHQLGIIAEQQRDFSSAERWYRKALAIKEKQGNEHGAASTYGQLGHLAKAQQDYAAAADSYLRALQLFLSSEDNQGARICIFAFWGLLQEPDANSKELEQKWHDAGLNEILPLQNLKDHIEETTG